PLRRQEVARVGEARPADPLAGGLAGEDPEAHRRGGAHLDRGDAGLAVALGEVAVADGVEGPLDADRDQQAGAPGELLGVDVPTVLAERGRSVGPLGA